ncbi:MAG: hypothetical protein ACREUZ_17710 [Burkholderiales bacterium]
MKRSTWRWTWTLAATATVSLIAASFWSDAGTPSGSGAGGGIEIVPANGSGGDLLAALPWIGWIAWVLVPMVGFGALLLERRDAWRHPAVV